MDRIVSLLPSLTETVCALDLADRLVGRSHECDHPPEVLGLPALTEPRLETHATSRAIDDRVKELVQSGSSVYRVDAERLRDLAPTVILTQDHCQVCAASLEDVETALARWLGRRPRLLSLAPRSLGDVWAGFLRVGEALGVTERAQQLAAELAWRLSELAEGAQARPDRPRVACLEWIDPLMAAGNWMPELVSLAGGSLLFGRIGQHSPWLDEEALRAADPDVVVVMPCGFDLPRTREEMPALLAQPGFAGLRAVGEGRAFRVDGHRFMNRPGPRLVESLQILCELLHPEVFEPTWRGDAWEPL